MKKEFKSRAIKGLKWTSLSRFGRLLFQYLSTIILVGILAPEDFGLLAMALVVIGFLDIFKDLGTGSAIIQQTDPSKELISTIYWINFLFGFSITVVIFFSAEIVSLIYGAAKLKPILQSLSVVFVISGLSIIQKSLMEKSLHFKSLAIIELISSFISFSLGIILAVNGYGVWSLVYQFILNSLLMSILIWIFCPWKPSFYFKFDLFKSVGRYSLNLVAFNVINYFSRNSDYFLIGKFLGDHPLGHYYLAYRIILFPLQNITLVISRVIFPTLSKIQNDNNEIRRFYLKITNTIAFITFPLIGILAFTSKDFVQIIFGTEWNIDLITILIIILAPVGLIQSISSTTGSLYQIKAKTDWMFRWGLFYSSITILGFLIGLRWGVIGVAASYLISNLLLVYPVFLFPFKLIDMNIGKFLLSFKGILLSVVIMLFSMSLVSILTSQVNSSLMSLSILSSVGLMTYLLVINMVNREYFLQLKSLFKQFSK